jgi:hypothetical protein
MAAPHPSYKVNEPRSLINYFHSLTIFTQFLEFQRSPLDHVRMSGVCGVWWEGVSSVGTTGRIQGGSSEHDFLNLSYREGRDCEGGLCPGRAFVVLSFRLLFRVKG